MKTRSKNNIRRIIAAVVLAAVLAGAFVLTACKKQPQQDPADAQKEPGKAGENVALTEAQKSAVLTAAEAFYESGLVYDERNPLSISRIEQFVYYIYNGELTAGEDGYGSVALDEAENRIMTLFGIPVVPPVWTIMRQASFSYAASTSGAPLPVAMKSL